ncbi:MAG: GNAT family N-acetyltransferase [Candidatus Diapherotrites archaeon]|nr:GNAT family N-acetyltransferase [Candidatus Diapherotrites archaeon]
MGMDFEVIRPGKEISCDLMDGLVRIHELCFQDDATTVRERKILFEAWNNPPVMQHWAAKKGNDVIGYIRWVEHGGIRPKAVVELEQIGIDPKMQGQGIATQLIDFSLDRLEKQMQEEGRSIKLVYVMTGNNNYAQKLYLKTLGARLSAEIPGFYEDSEKNENEVVMIARKSELDNARKNRNDG